MDLVIKFRMFCFIDFPEVLAVQTVDRKRIVN